jgi:hypothetical protein
MRTNCGKLRCAQAPGASEEPMAVTFREVSTWSLWVRERCLFSQATLPSPAHHELVNHASCSLPLWLELHSC